MPNVEGLGQNPFSFKKLFFPNSLQKRLVLMSSDSRDLCKMKGKVGPLHPAPLLPSAPPPPPNLDPLKPALQKSQHLVDSFAFSFAFSTTQAGATASFRVFFCAFSYKFTCNPLHFH